MGFRLLALLMLLGAAAAPTASNAQAVDCSDFPNSTIDGNVDPNPPSNIGIDGNCTIRNFPESNPLDSNFEFYAPGGGSWLIIFDNVFHIGNMSCNSNDIHQHKIWFTNGSSSGIRETCRDLFIPVEKIDKQTPGPTAAIRVPFTYTLRIPVLFQPGPEGEPGIVVDDQGSPNELHSVTIWDDLNETGADLDYVSHVAYLESNGAALPHTFSNLNGFLTFDDFPIVPVGEQIILEITVVLDDSPANTPGTQFVNTARWDFGRLIDGVFFEPLPGEWGISPPMTIVGPDLVFSKTGPATLNLGEQGDFTLDVHNIGNGDAWDATILDRLPDGPNGGMCDTTPQIMSARVFAADGVTPVPGKGPLVQGSDFSLDFTAAPRCELTLTMLNAAAVIGGGEHLIISYRTQLDSDTENGVALTNVAGATEWFNGDSSNPDRVEFARPVTNGTVGTLDHQDAHTVTTAFTGSFFEKTVANVTTGTDPTTGAAPGDTLRYTLRLRTTDTPINDVSFRDDLGAMNAGAVFVPGSLSLVAGTVPAGADASNTNPNGGTNGAGTLDIRNLSVPVDSEVQVQFDITLQSVIADGTIVTNQADLIDAGGDKIADSDDPNVNGVANPDIDGDEDPTRVVIGSGPVFEVEKISTYITGDPNVLLAGETLRYTITVQNVGSDDASDVVIVDQIPANTSYVAGSTTLNGIAVPDLASGVAPLTAGILVSTPEDPTPGTLHAVVPPSQGHIATIVFDVVVDADVVDGTIISNQAFVSAPDQDVNDQPSDDPRTSTPDDPTRDVVGNFPLLFAPKSAALEIDMGTPGIVDPGDVLRYTIAIHNNGSIPATMVDLTDTVPANTTYVADSVTLNGLPVGQPDGGVFPLAAGIPVGSSDLTPPVPAPGEGTISAGETAVVQFDLRVDDGVPSGTIISNQAVAGSYELPDLLTDGDGNPATGPEPTIVVVGDAQQLTISKQVSVVGGGAATAGAVLEYVVTVRNVAAVPAYYVEIVDNLDEPEPGQLIYVDQSATMNGQTNGLSFAGPTLTADYSSVYGPLEPGQSIVLRFRATLEPTLPIGTTVTNTARVYWNDPQQTASASVSINVGGVPGTGILSGTVWHDADFDNALDGLERLLENWTVQLYRNGNRVHTTVTDADGNYRMLAVPPNYQTDEPYALVFSAPGAGPATAALGVADSDFSNYLQRIDNIEVNEGSNLQSLNLPIDPNGVVYDALARSPIAGATLTLLDAASGTPLPDTCFDDPNQQDQVTLADGWYKFIVSFSAGACQSGGGYLIRVTPPGTNYVDGPSELIPPATTAATLPFDVPMCPGSVDDAIPGTSQYCEAQPSEFAPGSGVPARSSGTNYYAHLAFDDTALPGSGEIFNNHIPVDPVLDGAVTITKTSPMLNVTRGQLVPYVITVSNSIAIDIQDVRIVDRFPAGFRYVEGSARIDDQPAEPVVSGLELTWSNLVLGAEGRHTLKLLLAVGAGVSEGEFTNRAQAVHALTGNPLSEEAFATVRLVPDPTFDCTDVIGKVFDDHNRNGYQDGDEGGLPGVRLVTVQGLAATTDEHGRFHFTCAITPNESRGSNFVLKLDDRTLPSGYRPSSKPVQIKRATRGKSLRFNFAASIHRVVGLDIPGEVFEPDSTEIRPQWRPRFGMLLEELQKGPAVLRLSYLADVEDERLAERRLKAVKAEIMHAWSELACCYELVIEPEVYWRLGAPPDKPKAVDR